ncbi:HSF-type DNA-binding-domain-containing protein [Pestalotiopsis sp. NC0098]|nr:HSF-type DNA-binding-domain-containing protein [Pestalotiopsis sp. NC0098]
MATVTESASRTILGNGTAQETMGARTVPIITTTTPTPTIKMSAPSPRGDPMDLTTPTSSSAPGSSSKSPEGDGHDQNNSSSNDQHQATNAAMPAPAIAAAAVHQPKIVQTAFIHKLYNMLEDPNIQHLISWSQSQESFVMSPSADFAKVLAQYFKHTNVSSFVRQLNMYGFHKVSDVFHTGNPETVLWEFKHGNGNFKRGDLVGLREIKRRASRHALVHREYNNSKPTPSQPGTPSEPMPPIPDGVDPRVVGIEHTLFDLTNRLSRSEEASQYMHVKHQAMSDTITRLLEFNESLARTVLSLVPNPNEPVHQDVLKLRADLQRQSEIFRAVDEPHEPPPLSSSRQYFSNIENPPLSPRALAQDDQRRLNAPQARGSNFYRPPVPSNLSIGSRRYGSTSGASLPTVNQPSPSPLRPQAPPVPAAHPLAHIEGGPGSLARRHTAADIRAHGWQPTPSPFASGPSSTQWPSSPSRLPTDDRGPRDTLSSFPPHSHSHSRPSTPPPPPPPFSNGISNMDSINSNFNNWTWGSANRENKNLAIKDSSLPPTRRGSMAHILNPTDTAEQENEDDPREDDRKRKRLL